MKKTTASPALNTSFSLSGALLLLAGTGMLAASGLSFQSTTASHRVIVDLNSWNYLTRIRLDVSRTVTPTAAELGAAQNFEYSFVDAKPVSEHSFAPKRVVRITRRALSVADRLPAVQAAPVYVPAAVLVATPLQLEAFQEMHLSLRTRFLSAIHIAPGMTTQVVTHEEALESDDAVSHVAAPVRVVRPVVLKAQVVRSRPKAVILKKALPIPARVAVIIQPAKVELAPPAVITQAEVKHVPVAPAITPVKVAQPPREAYAQISELSKSVFANMPAPAAPKVAVASNPAQVTTQQMTEAAAPAANNEVVQKASTGASILVGTGGGYSSGTQSDYSSINLFKIWQEWKSKEHAAPHGTYVAQASQATDTARDVDPVLDYVHIVTPPVVEAYEWKTAITDSTAEHVTLEGWKRLSAVDHWPVLHWSPDSQARAAMISHNAAVLLAKLAEVQLQQDAAIVFGKIPAGWNVEFSDRAEKVIYTDEHNRMDASSEGPRYFTFLNAAPGAQLITLKAVLGAETAAVAVPVLDGVSTYLDLTAVSKRAFNGYVLDATAQTRKPVAGTAVSVIGQPNAVFFATESGYFNLSEVYAVGSYPVYVETSTAQGFKHRYRITPDRMENLDLFRMSDTQIQGWIGQLEGGVSPDSGMIVAAMPKLTRKYGDGRLFAGTHSLLPNRTLNPETYIVSEDGALDAGKPLEIAASRFVSVQVPAGPVVSHVEDNNRNIVWSQLVLAQPGVINIVGPY